MDVSGWTIDQKMRLPDWCFGNRQVLSVYQYNDTGGTTTYQICEAAMPDPACIWQAVFVTSQPALGANYFRIGMANVCPTTIAQMDAVDEIFPNLGTPNVGPNLMSCWQQLYTYWSFDCRKGIVTGGQKIVISVRCIDPTVRCLCALVVSGLPTSMAGWMAHNK